MTGEDCLVFVVGDRDQEQVVGGRRFAAREAYSIGRELGAKPDVLPCAYFFVDPATSRDVCGYGSGTICLRPSDVPRTI